MSSSLATADFVIITALEEELNAILEQLPGYKKLEKDGIDVHTYYQAQIKTNRSDGASYTIIITCLVGMGPINASAKAVAINHRWKPRGVLLVGIGGGVKGEINLGDVFVADQIADGTLGKISAEEPVAINHKMVKRNRVPKRNANPKRKYRWQAIQVDRNLLDQVSNFSTGWEQRIKAKRPKAGKPTRQIGTVVSGGDVIAHEDTVSSLRTTWPKLIGVEMEGGAIAIALSSVAERPAFLMVRGVSDLADNRKNVRSTKVWRPYACAVAAAYAICLLEGGPLIGGKSLSPVRSRQRKPKHSGASVNSSSLVSVNVEGNEITPINVETKKILNELERLNKQQAAILASLDDKQNLHELLKIAEAANPGLSFSANTTSEATTYVIQAKPGADNLEIGHLVFDQHTAAGLRGLRKLENALDEGLSVEFTPEECQWESQLKLPWRSLSENNGKLRLAPRIPDIKNPIKLICLRDSDVLATLNIAYASVVRVGRRVVEVKISEGKLAGEVSFILHKNSTKTTVSINLKWWSTTAANALDTVNLFLALCESPIFIIEYLESGERIMGRFNTQGINKDHLLHIQKLLKSINVINQKFNVDLRFPEKLKNEDARHLTLLAKAISEGGIVHGNPGRVNITVPKVTAEGFLMEWKKRSPSTIEIRRHNFSIELLGQKLEIGEWISKFEKANPCKKLKDFEADLKNLSTEQNIVVSANYQELTEIFPLWQHEKPNLIRRSRRNAS